MTTDTDTDAGTADPRPGRAIPAPVTILRTDTLFVKGYFGRRPDLCVIVFDPMREDLSLDREAFGEAFLAAYGYDAIHVVPARNAWFQDPMLPEALGAIAALARAYPRVVTYGSSMGGYAALRFGARLGATLAIAISPQYSVLPAVIPREKRWPLLRENLAWLHETPGEPIASIPEVVLFYDPCGADGVHAEAIRRDLPHAVVVPLRNAGHPVGGLLVELGVLAAAIVETIHGRLDAAALPLAFRRRRHKSGAYHGVLARRQPLVRIKLKARLAARAAELKPDEPLVWSYAGLVREVAGPHDEALALHAQATQGEPYGLGELRRARSLWRAGHAAAARATMERARRLRPTDPTPLELGAIMAALDGAPATALAMLAALPALAGSPRTVRLLRRLAGWRLTSTAVGRALGRAIGRRMVPLTVFGHGGVLRELAEADAEAE